MDNFSVTDRPKVFIETEDFRAVIIGINTDARAAYQKIIEEAKEAEVTNIYDKRLPYWEKLKELEDFIATTHVMNSIIARYSEIVALRDETNKIKEGAN